MTCSGLVLPKVPQARNLISVLLSLLSLTHAFVPFSGLEKEEPQFNHDVRAQLTKLNK